VQYWDNVILHERFHHPQEVMEVNPKPVWQEINSAMVEILKWHIILHLKELLSNTRVKAIRVLPFVLDKKSCLFYWINKKSNVFHAT
jgi:hypothetical protein